MPYDDYATPKVPPATPPVIDSAADASAAATLPDVDGDSDHDGPNDASFDRSAEDEEIAPGEGPDEVTPGGGDTIEPTGPSEIEIEREDVDEPGNAPAEVPPEILTPPD